MEPNYFNGDFIFVDPDVDVAYGQDVITRLNDGNEVTLKQLLIEGERKYLRSRNPDWPDRVIELPADAQIVGVVIGKWVDP
jgi:SOS-response transcriptional repressor LexA